MLVPVGKSSVIVSGLAPIGAIISPEILESHEILKLITAVPWIAKFHGSCQHVSAVMEPPGRCWGSPCFRSFNAGLWSSPSVRPTVNFIFCWIGESLRVYPETGVQHVVDIGNNRGFSLIIKGRHNLGYQMSVLIINRGAAYFVANVLHKLPKTYHLKVSGLDLLLQIITGGSGESGILKQAGLKFCLPCSLGVVDKTGILKSMSVLACDHDIAHCDG